MARAKVRNDASPSRILISVAQTQSSTFPLTLSTDTRPGIGAKDSNWTPQKRDSASRDIVFRNLVLP